MAVWHGYAGRNKLLAAAYRACGDVFGAELCLARATVRLAAAELLAACASPEDAAREMHRRATALWQRDLPFVGFDAAAVQYVQARIWQDCAHMIDPSLPQVQPRLEWK